MLLFGGFSFGWPPGVGELLQLALIGPVGLMEECLEEGIISAHHGDKPNFGLGAPATASAMLLNSG